MVPTQIPAKHQVPFLLFLLFFTFPRLSAGEGVSTTGVQFLKVPAGVRGAGMGGMFTAVADDVSAPYWNSAGLALLDKVEIGLLHVAYFAGTNYEFGGLAVPIGTGSTLGISASFDSVPSFNSTNDPSAVPGTASDLSLSLGFGQGFGKNFAFGVGGKFISSSLVSSTAVGGALDAGVLVFTERKDWTLGLSVQNLGQLSQFAQYSSQEKLPLVYRGGVAYRFQPEKPTHFLLGIDLEKPLDGGVIVHSGGEVWVGMRDLAVAFRAGYTFDPLNQDLGPSAGAALGAGVRFSGLELNYALVPFGLLGDTQRFSLTYRFGTEEGGAPQAAKAPERLSAVDIDPQVADYQKGTIKSATIELRPQAKTEISNWTVDITDDKGRILRSYSGKGVPPKQIAWDGRDSQGYLVPGAITSMVEFKTVEASGQRVTASQPLLNLSQAPARVEVEPLAASLAPPQPKPFMAPVLPADARPEGMAGVLRVPSLNFPEGGYRVNPGYEDYLRQVARLIRKYPNARVYLEGHAYDEGSEREALSLSQDRADAVLRYLVEKEKVSPDNLYSRGHGLTAPLVREGPPEDRAKNRRVDIIILTK